MMINEKQELVQQLLADLDAHSVNTREGDEVGNEIANEEEDFALCSG